MELERTAIIFREHDYASPQSSSGPSSNIRNKRRAAGVKLSVMPSTDATSNFQGELHGQQALDLSLTGPLLERWCMSDDDFKYFTGFSTKVKFSVFWTAIEPSASRILYWSNAKRTAPEESVTESKPQHKLPLIDEFFMFCLYLTLGQKEEVLARTFGVSISRVSQILITWTDYLYLLLGSIQVWMTPNQVRHTIPVQVLRYCQKVRVIVASTELTCENPETKTVGPENLSACRSCTTFKALIGVAPCGSVTFVSKLFPGSLSNNELTLLSGILELLVPGDQLIANKDFNIEGLLTGIGVKLLTFPLKRSSNFTDSDKKARAVARLHAVAERAIKRIKENQILDSPVKLSLAGTVNKIWSCCSMMMNFQSSLDPVGS